MSLRRALRHSALGTPLALLLAACARTEAPTRFEPVATPAGAGSSTPVLSSGADRELRLLWTEPRAGGGHALRFCALEGERWGPARTIAQGEGWFVNWADVPALAAWPDGTLAATWLEKLGESTYAYGVRWALSGDGGTTWEAREFLHEDRSAGEHGFVSLALLDAQTLRAVWLDGRGMQAQAGHGEHGGHGGQGAMALYTRTLSRSGELGPETELDARVCDCCPTAQLALDGGAALALYRDRGLDERRDLSVAAFGADGTAVTRELVRDGWVIDGCPVNGAALARSGDVLACAWFTLGGDETARVRAAFSRDGGASFGAPLELARGNALGALSGAFDEAGTFWVAWLESASGTAQPRAAWMLRGVHPERGPRGAAFELVETLPARVAGIARLALHAGRLWFAWVEVGQDGATRVRTARVAPPRTPEPQEKNS
jgi:hypothetical protein